jgi:hypothetical protein
MLTLPNVALETAMACRVFRYIRLGVIKKEDGNTIRSTTLFSMQRSQMSSNNDSLKVRGFQDSRNVAISIAKTTEVVGEPRVYPPTKASSWEDDGSQIA